MSLNLKPKLRFNIGWPLFTAFSLFLAMSNDFDWDHFMSFAEVDLRSWLADGQLPEWTYQLCGGVVRLADPQAFSASPIFLPIIAFGSFYGLKILVLLCAVLGWWALRKTAVLLTQVVRPHAKLNSREIVSIDVLAAAFIFSNYFLWHAHHGHITFSQIFLFIAIAYYFLKACFAEIDLRDSFIVSVFSFTFLSGGFYHAAIFFGVPFLFSALLIVFTFARYQPQRLISRSAAYFSLAVFAGVLLAKFKWSAVLQYQATHPRTIDQANEHMSLLLTPVLHLLPTYRYRFLGLRPIGQGTWGIWEFSAFNLLAWIVIIGGIAALLRRYRSSGPTSTGTIRFPKALTNWLIGLFAVCIMFSLPTDEILSGHRILNIFLNNSVRVASRYQIVLIYWFFLVATVMVVRFSFLSEFLSRQRIWFAVMLMVNMSTFSTLNSRALPFLTANSGQVPEKINRVFVTKVSTDSNSFMYLPTLHGLAVLNCYNPISRGGMVTRESTGRNEFMQDGMLVSNRDYPLIRDEVSAECRENTYLTQNELIISPSCPAKTCFNINDVNPFRPPPQRLTLDREKGLFCLGETP